MFEPSGRDEDGFLTRPDTGENIASFGGSVDSCPLAIAKSPDLEDGRYPCRLYGTLPAKPLLFCGSILWSAPCNSALLDREDTLQKATLGQTSSKRGITMFRTRLLLPCLVAAMLVSGSAWQAAAGGSHAANSNTFGRQHVKSPKVRRQPVKDGLAGNTPTNRSRHRAGFVAHRLKYVAARVIPLAIIGSVLVGSVFGIPASKGPPKKIYAPFSKPAIHGTPSPAASGEILQELQLP